MNRKILLIEPNYKNKYPPMSLMKIATYYKSLGDDVTFFKGKLQDLVLNDTYKALLKQLYANDSSIFWEKYKPEICKYLKKGLSEEFYKIPLVEESLIINSLLKYYRRYFRNKEYFYPENRIYDKIAITTLFTFYWDITIDTINFAKQLCKNEKDVLVGGVMASILPNYIQKETNIYPIIGPLIKPKMLGDDNDIIIDSLPLDYSILEEIDYIYPANDGYLAYMTRGCINKCKFCAVPKLEPEYKNYLPIAKQIKLDEEIFGAKRNLLLLDNNVLASTRFNEIIDNIKLAGFYKDATYIEPNTFEIAIKNLRNNLNDKAYIKCIVKEYKRLIEKLGKNAQEIYDLLDEHYLLNADTATKEAILSTYDFIKDKIKILYSKKPRKRYVDFNQGIDARLITEDNMKKMAEIPVRPVRIAFDNWKIHKIYEKAVRTAVKYGHKNLSNYILYNFEDTPLELYIRLKLNVDLCEELNASIYSFPMKYHPIEDPNYFSNRDYIGKHWNRKFIRTIQAILNSTKGKVGKGKSFFEEAFGKNEQEFEKLLYMPEVMIIYRFYYKDNGITEKWWQCFNNLSPEKLAVAKKIIETNDFSSYETTISDKDILNLLSYYRITRKDTEKELQNKGIA